MAIRWVFFDVGDVLFDENAQHQYYAHSLLLALRRYGVEVRWDDYRALIHQLVRSQPSTAIVDAARSYVDDTTLWERVLAAGLDEYRRMRTPRPYGMLLDNMRIVVEDLHRDFKLGVIANQHPPVADAIRDYGLMPYFDVIAINEIVGLSKPDPALFRWAIDQAGCAPEEALMIGDRPDHDIAPARTVGMATVRFRRGDLYTHYEPLSDLERADRVVSDILQLAPAVRSLASARS
jgi:HAD superfamily hydrolase (TIGR01549 family)